MITDCLSEITDPRKNTNEVYSLESLVLIIFSSVISGYDTVEEMVEFTTLKLEWLNKWVELKRVPNAETLRFIICAICPKRLTQCFKKFVELNGLSTEGDCISIDGKTMRGTGNIDNDAIHIISAWSNKHSITLAALESKGKKNEIHTIPDVMDMVAANNAIFSTDAMGCQTKIAEKAIDTGNDYMLQIKDNQANLLKEIQAFYHKIEREGYTKDQCDTFEEIDKGHGRIEVRKYTQFQLTDWINGIENWKNLTTAVKVERTRIISDKDQGV